MAKEFERTVICPHCSYEYDSEECGDYYNDGLEKDGIECVSCDKKFNLEVSCTWDFTTKKPACENGCTREPEEDLIWQMSHTESDFVDKVWTKDIPQPESKWYMFTISDCIRCDEFEVLKKKPTEEELQKTRDKINGQ